MTDYNIGIEGFDHNFLYVAHCAEDAALACARREKVLPGIVLTTFGEGKTMQYRTYVDVTATGVANIQASEVLVRRCQPKRRETPKPAEFTLTRAEWSQILLEHPRCPYCDHEFTPDNPPMIDHVVPLKHGGHHNKDNARPVCTQCLQGTPRGAALIALWNQPGHPTFSDEEAT